MRDPTRRDGDLDEDAAGLVVRCFARMCVSRSPRNIQFTGPGRPELNFDSPNAAFDQPLEINRAGLIAIEAVFEGVLKVAQMKMIRAARIGLVQKRAMMVVSAHTFSPPWTVRDQSCYRPGGSFALKSEAGAREVRISNVTIPPEGEGT